MKNCKSFVLIVLAIGQIFGGCNAQTNKKTQRIGGACDGCEIMHIGQPKQMNEVDTSAAWGQEGQPLIITGKVFKVDGRTPASDIVIYYWHTDSKGYYTSKEGMPTGAKQHGYLRGWVKTNSKGEYTIYTIRPAPYPNEKLPAHIHMFIKEPQLSNEYYIDDLNFDDDPLLLPYIKKYPLENRGGTGLLRVLLKGGVQIAEHNIILGLNIPNYPKTVKERQQSGLAIGQDQPSFIPYHAFGPDAGTQTCPVCKYGRYHGIIYFVGNTTNWNEVKQWLVFLEAESQKRQQYLKAYFVYGNEKNYSKAAREAALQAIGKELNIQRVALTFVPSFSDKTTEAFLNKINSTVQNTFIIYKHRNIVDKYINLSPTPQNFALISEVFNKTQGEYFGLKAPAHH